MKTLAHLCFCLILFSCGDPNLSFEQFEGNWVRAHNTSGELTTERWWNENGLIQGFGLTTRGSDTVFREDLSIELRNGQYYYVVRGVNESPTEFQLTEFSDDYFQFSNADNPFPSKILYQFPSDSMIASLSGNGNTVEFRFGRE